MSTAATTHCRVCEHPPVPKKRLRLILAVTASPLVLLGLVTVPAATLLLLGALFIVFTAVVLHEAGHLVAARRCGAAVTEFALGFGPVLAARHARGLNWTIRAVPLGGFCHVVGQDESDGLCEVHARDFPGVPMHEARCRDQLAIAMSGVGVNMIFAWALMLPVVGYLVHDMTGEPTSVNTVLVTLGVTTMTAAMIPFLTYVAIGAYLWAIPTQGWSDSMGSVLSLPEQMDTMMATGAGAALPGVYVLLLVAVGVHISLGALNALPAFPLDGFHATAIVVRGLRGGKPMANRAVVVMASVTAAPLAVFVIGLAVKDIVGMAS